MRWPRSAIGARDPGSASAQRPWRKNVAGRPRVGQPSRTRSVATGAMGPVGVLGVERQRDAEGASTALLLDAGDDDARG